MKNLCILLIIIFICCSVEANNNSLKSVWEHYESIAEPKALDLNTQSRQRLSNLAGKLIGNYDSHEVNMLNFNWKYRDKCYEIYFDTSSKLASSIYTLAIDTGDITKTLPRDKFIKGVQGFHYDVSQICTWLNRFNNNLYDEELIFVGWLLQDGIINVVDGHYSSGKTSIVHILGAAPGKRRSFESNLRHERIHVYWDENKEFSENACRRWLELSDSEEELIKQKLKGYDKDNLSQLIEEWAVYEAEQIPDFLIQ